MGVTYMLELENVEARREADKIIEALGGAVSVAHADCWIEAQAEPGCLPVVEVSCTSGSFPSGILEAVVREMCNRLPVRRVGSDAVGWFPDSDFRTCPSLADADADNWVDHMRTWEPSRDESVWAALTGQRRADQYRLEISTAVAAVFAAQVGGQGVQSGM